MFTVAEIREQLRVLGYNEIPEHVISAYLQKMSITESKSDETSEVVSIESDAVRLGSAKSSVDEHDSEESEESEESENENYDSLAFVNSQAKKNVRQQFYRRQKVIDVLSPCVEVPEEYETSSTTTPSRVQNQSIISAASTANNESPPNPQQSDSPESVPLPLMQTTVRSLQPPSFPSLTSIPVEDKVLTEGSQDESFREIHFAQEHQKHTKDQLDFEEMQTIVFTPQGVIVPQISQTSQPNDSVSSYWDKKNTGLTGQKTNANKINSIKSQPVQHQFDLKQDRNLNPNPSTNRVEPRNKEIPCTQNVESKKTMSKTKAKLMQDRKIHPDAPQNRENVPSVYPSALDLAEFGTKNDNSLGSSLTHYHTNRAKADTSFSDSEDSDSNDLFERETYTKSAQKQVKPITLLHPAHRNTVIYTKSYVNDPNRRIGKLQSPKSVPKMKSTNENVKQARPKTSGDSALQSSPFHHTRPQSAPEVGRMLRPKSAHLATQISVIRTPQLEQKEPGRIRRHDPVSRFQHMTQEWAKYPHLRKNAQKRRVIVKNVNESQMITCNTKSIQQTHHTFHPNKYVPPTDKRRDELRWKIRTMMANTEEAFWQDSPVVKNI